MFQWIRNRRLKQRLLEARAIREEKRREESTLMTSLMALENTRLEQQISVDKARAELELKRVQWELEHAEGVQRAKEADLRLRQELREKQREHSQKMRDAKKAKQAVSEAARTSGNGECRVCRGGFHDLSAEEITWHYNGHAYGGSLFDK